MNFHSLTVTIELHTLCYNHNYYATIANKFSSINAAKSIHRQFNAIILCNWVYYEISDENVCNAKAK